MVSALLGGALIGAAATVYTAATGRTAGVSGILRGALRAPAGLRRERLLFLAGLIAAGVGAVLLGARPAAPPRAAPLLLFAGLLVGFGTRLGGGCTSGHGVCGLSRRSLRSLVATVTFMATGALTVFLAAHVLGGAP
jgi:uncharacterized membrane protein YedE/YeeE